MPRALGAGSGRGRGSREGWAGETLSGAHPHTRGSSPPEDIQGGAPRAQSPPFRASTPLGETPAPASKPGREWGAREILQAEGASRWGRGVRAPPDPQRDLQMQRPLPLQPKGCSRAEPRVRAQQLPPPFPGGEEIGWAGSLSGASQVHSCSPRGGAAFLPRKPGGQDRGCGPGRVGRGRSPLLSPGEQGSPALRGPAPGWGAAGVPVGSLPAATPLLR